MGSFPFAFSYFPATLTLLHHLLYLGTFMRACFVSRPCKGFFWAVMHAEKVHFISGCFFGFWPSAASLFVPVAGGLGSAFERHNAEPAAVRVDVW